LGVNSQSQSGGRIKFVNGFSPNSVDNDIMASDVIKTAIHRIAEEVSKCSVKSVREVDTPTKATLLNNDTINRVLNSWVNPFCILKDFLYKLAWTLITNENVFVYWHFREVTIASGNVRRDTLAFYIIEADKVKIYLGAGDETRIEFQKNNNVVYDMPYQDIIHIRRKFGRNTFLGGDASGNFDARA
jgi:hypothetical protein